MSFRFGKRTVTLQNYADIFSACSPDVLDEIRSAVLDDTPIGEFIKPCGSDSYKLGQIRLALREMLPKEFISSKVTGKTTYTVRQGFIRGRDMHPIIRYYKILEPELIEQLAVLVYEGVNISRQDFTKVPNNLFSITCEGLAKGYPMWIIVGDGNNFTESGVRLLMRGLQLGVDIHPFLEHEWDMQTITFLLNYSQKADLAKFMSMITHCFDYDLILTLASAFENGVDISKFCVRDSVGYPVYNSYQVEELVRAEKNGVLSRAMLSPINSDAEIRDMVDNALSKKNFSVRLQKSSEKGVDKP